MNKTDICNMALGHIGEQSITDISEASENARRCALYYEPVREELLRSHAWNFAGRVGPLALTKEKIPGWRFAYAYPASCVYLRRVFDPEHPREGRPAQFCEINSADTNAKVILCNVAHAWAEYTFNVREESLFDPAFASAFSYALAARLALPLTGDQNILSAVARLAAQSVDNARLADKWQEKKRTHYTSVFIEARE